MMDNYHIHTCSQRVIVQKKLKKDELERAIAKAKTVLLETFIDKFIKNDFLDIEVEKVDGSVRITTTLQAHMINMRNKPRGGMK